MIAGELSIAVGGQSLADWFRRRGSRPFNRTLRSLRPDAPPARIWGFTCGGSMAASTNVSPFRRGDPARYWWDMEADAPSAALIERLDKVAALASQPCECLVWDQGQFEATPLKGKHGRDPAIAREHFRVATRSVLQFLRERLSPNAPERLPILFMPHAPHPGEGTRVGLGVERVRAVQYELIAQIPNCHDVGIVHGMEMHDNMHPSEAGMQLYAESLAKSFAAKVLPLLTPEPGPVPELAASA